jgi:hypothetical protein
LAISGRLRQYRRDVFMGEAMKPVAPDAFLIERVGQREGLLDLLARREGGIDR